MIIICRQILFRSIRKFSFNSHRPTTCKQLQHLQPDLGSDTSSRRFSSVLLSPVKKYFSTQQKRVYDDDEEWDLHRPDTDASSSSSLINRKTKKKKSVIPISTSLESPLFKNLSTDEQEGPHSLQQPQIKEQNTTHQKVNDIFNNKHRISLLMELNDKVGILHDILRYFWKYNVNISRIESRPCTNLGKFDFLVDIEINEVHRKVSKSGGNDDSDGEDDQAEINETMDLLLHDLKQFQGLEKLLILDEKEGKYLTCVLFSTIGLHKVTGES